MGHIYWMRRKRKDCSHDATSSCNHTPKNLGKGVANSRATNRVYDNSAQTHYWYSLIEHLYL